jgi:hypothetical protein
MQREVVLLLGDGGQNLHLGRRRAWLLGAGQMTGGAGTEDDGNEE